MNYELALELKKSGFPFHGIAEGKEAWDGKAYIEEGTLLAYALPTLEELIEACGDGSFNLRCSRDGVWDACAPHKTIRQIVTVAGATPTEAVARLWLAKQ